MSGLEKKYQDEVTRTFNCLGWARRLEHDSVICDRCGSAVHPRNAGFPDVHAELYTSQYHIPIKVEAKAFDFKFEYTRISDDQHKFLGDYIKNGGVAYIWLQLGSSRVNSQQRDKRRVYLIPYSYCLETTTKMKDEYGLMYIPLYLIPRMHLKDDAMTAERLYANYICEWIPLKEVWRPNKRHEFWNLKGLRINYEQFASANE